MKKIKHILLKITMGVCIVLVSSCDLQDANINPNAKTDVSINVLLPMTQTNLVWAVSDFAAHSASTLVQYLSGALNVQFNVTQYDYLPAHFQTTWNNHFYAGALKDLKTIIEKSTAEGALHYRGVAKIETAIALGYLVDFWGDVPYSQALDLVTYPKPVYDDDAALYNVIFTLLDEGIADLNSPSTISPTREDLLYPANTELLWRTNSIPKWIKAANSLKARYHNHLSKVDPTGSATNALAAITAGGFTANADDLKFAGGATAELAGPWFGFLSGSFGQNNIAISSRFITMLNDRVSAGVDDPRLRYYVTDNLTQTSPPVALVDENGNYVGTPYGSGIPAGASKFGPYVNTPGSATNIMTYVELKFIEAEANFRLTNYAAAATAFNAAVKASILRVTGSANAAYETIYANEDATTIQVNGLQKIFTEKHIALFLEAESWADWRRSIPAGAPGTASGIPTLTPAAANVTGGVFPRRFLYPTSELDNNTNIPTAAKTDRVFWDL
jgi:hypothetical protein